MIKILIADDQELIRQSLMIILDNIEDFQVTDSVADGIEVMASATCSGVRSHLRYSLSQL